MHPAECQHTASSPSKTASAVVLLPVLFKIAPNSIENTRRSPHKLRSAVTRAITRARCRDHADLCDGEIVMNRIAAVGFHAWYDNQILASSETSRKRPFHVARIFRIDVVFNDNDKLEQVHQPHREQHGALAFLPERGWCIVANDVARRPMPPSVNKLYLFDRGRSCCCEVRRTSVVLLMAGGRSEQAMFCHKSQVKTA